MSKKEVSPFLTALKYVLPLGLGNAPLAFFLGTLFEQEGFHSFFAPLFSLLVNGGSVQLTAFSLFVANSTFLTLALATLPLAVRNSFYSLSMADRYKHYSRWMRVYLAFGLVDGVFSILASGPRFEGKQDRTYCFYLTLFNHSIWILCTIAGVIVGKKFNLPEGLDFFGGAIFVALVVDQFCKIKRLRPFIFSALSFFLAFFLMPSCFLLGSIVLYILFSLFFSPKEEASNP